MSVCLQKLEFYCHLEILPPAKVGGDRVELNCPSLLSLSIGVTDTK